MADVSMLGQLMKTAETLSDEQVRLLLQAAQAMRDESERPPYDEANDPTIGMISGPTDLSHRYKEILRDEIDPRSGWTRKGKLPPDYDPKSDPAIGFLKNAPPDYAERAKDILREDIDPHSGWTQKDKLP
jgi:hypothetical protein